MECRWIQGKVIWIRSQSHTQQYAAGGNQSNERFLFPQPASGNDRPFRGCYRAQSGVKEFAGNNDDNNPGRDKTNLYISDQYGGDKYFIGSQVQEDTQGRNEVVAPRQVPIQ